MASVEDILLPDIGDFSNVEIIEILVAPGDRIESEQTVLTLESEKATIEIPSPRAGLVKELLVKVGDRVSRDDPLLRIETAGAAEPAAQPAVPAQQTASPAVERPKRGAAGTSVSVVLPDVGDFSDIPVIEVLVAPGEHIAVGQSLLTLESDKATMEIPSPQAGVVDELLVRIGDTLNPGDLILTLSPDDDRAAEPSAKRAEPEPPTAGGGSAAPLDAPLEIRRAPGEAEPRQAPILPRPEDMAAVARRRTAHASPAIRRFARELGVDLVRVKGSGPKGRILKDDVQSFVKQALSQGGSTVTSGSALPFPLPAAPEVDHARFGPVERIELPRIKKISGRHLHRCWLTVPHVTQFEEADITELESFRKSQQEAAATDGVKLTFLPFLLKAAAAALARMPILKASLSADGEGLIHKNYTHIGVAVDTPNGLLVPVVRDVDKKGLHTLARELAELSARGRDGKLLPGDMQGGCFTISSLGGLGGTAFTPIVNAPEVAILGVSRSEMKPVWNGAEFVPRLMLPLSLSYDHRVVDGADGARFASLLRQLLGDIRRLLL